MSFVPDDEADFSIEGNEIQVTNPRRGDTKYNAMWKDGDGVSEGEHYWEMYVCHGNNAWFGLTTQEKFAKGYQCQAIQYSNNVARGGALLTAGFGKKQVEGGDQVGVLVTFGDELVVTFYHNGECLGPAFQLPAPYPTNVYPVVSLKNQGDRVRVEKKDPPSERERFTAPVMDGLEGEWQASTIDGEPVDFGRVNVVGHGGGVYQVMGMVANRLRTTVTMDPIGASPVLATMMMGEPKKMEVEAGITKAFTNLKRFELDGLHKLVVEGDATLCCERSVEPTPGIVRSNPWLR
eukprot:GHVU01120094.1.p1 GENE.GHVU01120094.1~~GHVU01120094.1.p1  ORF type:complete len:292 (-),score=39.99 GHVU01120094.1:254-1129(-)